MTRKMVSNQVKNQIKREKNIAKVFKPHRRPKYKIS